MILHLIPGSRRLERFDAHLSEMILDRKIKPKLIDKLGSGRLRGITHVLAHTQDMCPNGILQYYPWHPRDEDDFATDFATNFAGSLIDSDGCHVRNPEPKMVGLSGYDFQKPLAVILYLESYRRRQGIGTQLLSTLQSKNDIAGIVLESLPGSHSFYMSRGFKQTGIYAQNRAYPILLWTRDIQ